MYENLYVSNLIIPAFSFGKEEKKYVLESRICKKINNRYMDLETRATYAEKQELGLERVDMETLVPLAEYYNSLGFKKRNEYANKNIVYQKVKHLKSQRKI